MHVSVGRNDRLCALDRADLKIDVFRSDDQTSGASDHAVRVTHITSKIAAVATGEQSETDDVASAIAK